MSISEVMDMNTSTIQANPDLTDAFTSRFGAVKFEYNGLGAGTSLESTYRGVHRRAGRAG